MINKSAARSSSPSRKLIVPTIAAVLGLVILLKLGFWQLDRLAWKEALIAKVTEDIHKTAVSAPIPKEWTELDLNEADYRHVSISGKFLDGATFYYIGLANAKGPYSGPGYFVYSPFQTDDGWIVMINRGFIPEKLQPDLRTEVLKAPAGSLELEGLLRKSEKPNWTTPAADEAKRIWFARDTDHMLKVLGVSAEYVAPYSIDLDARFTPAAGVPQAGETIVKFKNDHLGYALTWFGLAATLVGVFAAYAIGLFRSPKENGSV